MPDSKPKKTTQFTESVAFIQSLFQQPESRIQRFWRHLKFIAYYGLWVLIIALIMAIFWFNIRYDLMNFRLTDEGLLIPLRYAN